MSSYLTQRAGKRATVPIDDGSVAKYVAKKLYGKELSGLNQEERRTLEYIIGNGATDPEMGERGIVIPPKV